MTTASLPLLFVTGLSACLAAQGPDSPLARLDLGGSPATFAPPPDLEVSRCPPTNDGTRLTYFRRDRDDRVSSAAELAAMRSAWRDDDARPSTGFETQPEEATFGSEPAADTDTDADAATQPWQPVRSKSALPYSYADARIVFGDLTGLAVEGSYAIDDNWFGTAHLLFGADSNVDLFTLSAGGGYRYPLAVPKGKLDLVASAELEYGSIQVTVGPFKVSDSEVGLRLRGGARYLLDQHWEVRAGLGLRTVFDSEFVLDLAGQYNIDDRWSLVVQLDLGSEFTLFGLGGRLVF